MGRPPDVTTRLVTQVEEKIRTGVYPPGSELRIRRLSAVFHVSRNTVTKALRELEAGGLVTRRRGEVARVTTRYTIISAANQSPTLDEEPWRGLPPAVVRAGGKPYCKVKSREVPAPSRVATYLDVPAGTPVIERARVQGAVEEGGETPVQLATSWYPADTVATVPEIVERLDIDPPPVRRRVLDAGREVHYEHTAEFRSASDVEARLLDLPEEGAYVVEVWRACVDHQTLVPVEVTLMVIDAKRVRLRY